MNNDFIQNAVNNLYQANELMALKAENASLQAEVERLTDELGLIHQMFEKHLTPQIRKAIVNAAKEGKPTE